MSNATMTSKGQITIPKDVREELGLTPGTRVSFTRSDTGEIVVRKQSRSVRELGGSLKYAGPPVSVEEMDAVLGAED